MRLFSAAQKNNLFPVCTARIRSPFLLSSSRDKDKRTVDESSPQEIEHGNNICSYARRNMKYLKVTLKKH